MLRHVAAGKDAAVHLRVQGLDTAVADLRKTGDLADAYSLDTFALKEFLGTARGYDLPTEVHETLDELHESCLVTNTN